MAQLSQLCDLRLFNPATKRVVIGHTSKVLGPEPQLLSQPEYDVTSTSVSVDTPHASDDVDDNKYLIGSMHLEHDDIKNYKAMAVVLETCDEREGPLIVAYRHHVTPTGKLLPVMEEDKVHMHTGVIVLYIAEYASDLPEKIFKKTTKHVAN